MRVSTLLGSLALSWGLLVAGCVAPGTSSREEAPRTVYRSGGASGGATPLPSLRVPGPRLRVESSRSSREPTAYRLSALDPVIIGLTSIPRPTQIEDKLDEHGNINLPFVGQIHAQGLTSAELERAIERAYVEGEIYKQITVNVNIPAQSYYVRGEVRQPGRFQLVGGVTLVQAIAAAGGYTEFAYPKKTKVIRGEDNLFYDLRVLEKSPEKDVDIEAGDVIVVPRSIL